MNRLRVPTRSWVLLSCLVATTGGTTACIPKASQSPDQDPEAAALYANPAAPPASAKKKLLRTGPAPAMERNLAEHFKSAFSLGVALEPQYLGDWSALIASTFNRITAENAMKCAQIHPAQHQYRYERADQLADYARSHNMKMTGHALVWHQETPGWLVQGKPAEVADQLKQHIKDVVLRYADVTDNWDVVNEAVSDSPGKVYRDGAEGSKLHAALGASYIADAFRFADAAVSASGKNIDLYYNDYNLAKADKRAKTIQMAKELRAAGVRIDGIGEQGHWSLTWPSTQEIERMISEIVSAGFKVKISELDISVYPRDDWDNKVWEPERVYDEALAQAQAARYQAIFELFVKNAAHIESVTFWGLSDDRTWLDQLPKRGRDNYPLLFNDIDQPKLAYFSLFDVTVPSAP